MVRRSRDSAINTLQCGGRTLQTNDSSVHNINRATVGNPNLADAITLRFWKLLKQREHREEKERVIM